MLVPCTLIFAALSLRPTAPSAAFTLTTGRARDLLAAERGPAPLVTHFVNPLDVDGFVEAGGWGSHGDISELPLLVFFPGMDGSLATPFMQYPELGTTFELACLRVEGGLESRAPFDALVEGSVEHVAGAARAGRRVLLVGESFGATLAVAVARQLQDVAPGGVAGLVVVNPATSYERSRLARVGPACAGLKGALLPLYPLALLLLAALVLTPGTQAPAFISMLASAKVRALAHARARTRAILWSHHRESDARSSGVTTAATARRARRC